MSVATSPLVTSRAVAVGVMDVRRNETVIGVKAWPDLGERKMVFAASGKNGFAIAVTDRDVHIPLHEIISECANSTSRRLLAAILEGLKGHERRTMLLVQGADRLPASLYGAELGNKSDVQSLWNAPRYGGLISDNAGKFQLRTPLRNFGPTKNATSAVLSEATSSMSRLRTEPRQILEASGTQVCSLEIGL